MSCDLCYNLDIEAYFASKEGQQRVTTAARLTQVDTITISAAKGCHGCSLLRRGLSLPAFNMKGRVHILFHAGLPLRIESSDIDLEFFVPYGRTLPTQCIGSGNIISPHLSAQQAASFAQEHLRKCKDSHKFCSSSAEALVGGARPERLIDLGYTNSHNYSDVRLVDAVDVDAPYVALSYCWGVKMVNLTTTRSNISKRRTAIKYNELPKTLQDAVDVTRSMGIRYIWIDSLCIIQDDIEDRDWRSESSKMDSIYQGALLTLAATRSEAVDSGFLGVREGISKNGEENAGQTFVISWTNFKGETEEVCVRQRLSHSAIVPEDSNPRGCPLLSRGWTFQERLMSTRTLHFLPHELMWECKSDFYCECLSVEADQSWKSGLIRGSLFNRAMSDPDSISFTTVWQNLITEYSKRLLTEEKDRLPALSGIARQLQASNHTRGRYLAGLWEGDFFWHLIWQAEHASKRTLWPDIQHLQGEPTEQSRKGKGVLNNRLLGSFTDPPDRLRKSRRPSWSWISTSFPVKWDTLRARELGEAIDATLISASCNHDLINPFGQVFSGRIVLHADVVSTTIEDTETTIWKLKIPWPTEAVMLPDTADLKLSPGDIIHCAVIYHGTKDGKSVWIALALRRVANHVADPPRAPRPPAAKKSIVGNLRNMSLSSGRSAGSQKLGPPEILSFDSRMPQVARSSDCDETLSAKDYLYRKWQKNGNLDLPVDSSSIDGGRAKVDEGPEIFYRVGLVKATAPLMSFRTGYDLNGDDVLSRAFFSGKNRREIIIE